MNRIINLIGLCAAAVFSAGFIFTPIPSFVPKVTTYTGPGDLATFDAWWGLRAYSAATRGNKAVNVCNVLDVACADLSTDPVTGKLVVTTIGGSNCGVVTCTVKTIYDQTGALKCASSTACDLTNLTIANRPQFVVSTVNSLPCLLFTGSSSQVLLGQENYTGVANFSVSYVAERTGAFSSYGDVFSQLTQSSPQSGFNNSANQALMFNGSLANASATDGTSSSDFTHFHAFQTVYNGASSDLYVDGSSNTVSPGAGAFPTAEFSIGGQNNYLTGYACEVGFASSIFTTQKSTLNSNQHTFWGF